MHGIMLSLSTGLEHNCGIRTQTEKYLSEKCAVELQKTKPKQKKKRRRRKTEKKEGKNIS